MVNSVNNFPSWQYGSHQASKVSGQIIEKMRSSFEYFGAGVFINRKYKSQIEILDQPRNLPIKIMNLTIDLLDVSINKYGSLVSDFTSTYARFGAGSHLFLNVPSKITLYITDTERNLGQISIESPGYRLSFRVTGQIIDLFIFPTDVFYRKRVETRLENLGNSRFRVEFDSYDEDLLLFYPSSARSTILKSDSSVEVSVTAYPWSLDEAEIVKAGLRLEDAYTLFATVDSEKINIL